MEGRANRWSWGWWALLLPVGVVAIYLGYRALSPCDPVTFEKARTEKLLGVAVEEFQRPQGPDQFDELPADAKAFRFEVIQRAPSGPVPTSMHERPRVVARGPAGNEYEAYCGLAGSEKLRQELAPGALPPSGTAELRHCYDLAGHWGYTPKDVFIGPRAEGKLTPRLVFPDVGSHNMRCHAMAVDGAGACHLVVADVDIFQSNRFHLYWVVGDLTTGRWTRAWLLDRRGFTSSASPWCAACGGIVHLLLAYDNAAQRRPNGPCGIYHVEWKPSGFGPKVHVLHGEVDAWANDWAAALDPATGRLLVAAGQDGGISVSSRPAGGSWTRATQLDPAWRSRALLSAEAAGDGTFTIRAAWSGSVCEYVVKPLP